jgi:hypothetical protein
MHTLADGFAVDRIRNSCRFAQLDKPQHSRNVELFSPKSPVAATLRSVLGDIQAKKQLENRERLRQARRRQLQSLEYRTSVQSHYEKPSRISAVDEIMMEI